MPTSPFTNAEPTPAIKGSSPVHTRIAGEPVANRLLVVGAASRRRSHLAARAFVAHRPLTGLTVAALVFGVSGVAQASAPDPVVPAGGKVAGEGYAYWLKAKEQAFFTAPPSGAKACGTLPGASGAVTYLNAGGEGTITCRIPAGRPIYVDGVANECSTLHGDHNGFGTSPAQLERCAQAGFKGLSGTATIDGAPVANYRSLIAATTVLHFHLAKQNPFKLKPTSATSAAYGEGLLLRGFAAGTHTVRISSTTPGGTNVSSYTLHVG